MDHPLAPHGDDRIAAALADPAAKVLAIRHRNGSVEHYYHFLLGFLLPLALHLEGAAPGTRTIVRSCGPVLDPILAELAIPELVVWPKPLHADAVARGRKAGRAASIDGFDLSPQVTSHDGDPIPKAAARVMARLRKAVAAETEPLADRGPHRVLAIERAPPDAYYLSAETELPGAGADRRIVANHAAMATALADRFPGFRNLRLEGMPLARQIALFSTADVVVAQHGAALANIAWMRPGSRVIEIVGRPLPVEHFAALSARVGVRHQYALQSSDFGNVVVNDIVRRVSRALDRPEAPPLRPPLLLGSMLGARLAIGAGIQKARPTAGALRQAILRRIGRLPRKPPG